MLVFGLSSSPVLPRVRARLDYVRTTAAGDSCRNPADRANSAAKQKSKRIDARRQLDRHGRDDDLRWRDDFRQAYGPPGFHRTAKGSPFLACSNRPRAPARRRDAAVIAAPTDVVARSDPSTRPRLVCCLKQPPWAVKAQCSLLAATPGHLLQAEPRRHVPLGSNARPARTKPWWKRADDLARHCVSAVSQLRGGRSLMTTTPTPQSGGILDPAAAALLVSIKEGGFPGWALLHDPTGPSDDRQHAATRGRAGTGSTPSRTL